MAQTTTAEPSIGQPRHYRTYGLIIVAVALLQLTGLLRFVDRELADVRFQAATRAASQQIVLVEMDARSLAELDVWPWPRRHYATALENLVAAGARQVAFDIDFSAASEAGNDATFEAALRRNGDKVRLSVFQQVGTDAAGEPYLHATRPIDRFRQYAELVSINVRPDADGLVRSYRATSSIDGHDYASIAAALTGIDRFASNLFSIDYGIRPDTIPRISFIDVWRGDFDPTEIEHRSIIIGATAVELGDRLAVPIWHNLSGPMLNVIAAESLLQDRALQSLHPILTLLLASAIVVIFTPAFARWSWRQATMATTVTSLSGFVATAVVQHYMPIMVDLAVILFALTLTFGISLFSRIDQQHLRIILDGIAANRRRALLQTVVEQSADGVLILDDAGGIIAANPSCARLFSKEMTAPESPVQALFVPATDETSAIFLEHLSASDPRAADGIPHEVIGVRPDGDRIELELLVNEVAVNHGRINRQIAASVQRNLVCTIRDITERKRMDAMKHRALEESLQAARAKSDFLATMNHELRTPLNHIIGFAEMLREGYTGPLNEKQLDYASGIAASGKDLLHLISEILEYANLDKGAFTDLKEEDVTAFALVEGCVDAMRDRASDANIDLMNTANATDSTMIRVDQGAIRQALLNILSNAIKFNKPDGRILVDAQASDGELYIVVSDTGIGMTPQQAEYALQPFSRIEGAMRRGKDGTGLGLPLAKSLIEAHGGSLTLHSIPDQGTTVYVTIPARRVFSAAPGTAGA